MLLKNLLLIGGLATLFASIPAAQAVPITITYIAPGSGTLGGVPFVDFSFVITAQADSANVENSGIAGVITVLHSSAQIELQGLGVFDFISPTRTFVSNASSFAGFSRGNGSSLISSFNSPELSTYNFDSNISINEPSVVLEQWAIGSPVVTSGGVLIFNNMGAFSNVAGFFSVSTGDASVPEPSSAALAGLGMAALWFGAHRRPSRRSILALLPLLGLCLFIPNTRADQPLKTALGLSVDQAKQVHEIQQRYLPQFAAKRQDRNTELRKLRRARIANDSQQIALLEKVTAKLHEELRQIRLSEDAEIRRLLTPEQNKRFEDYVRLRKEMVGSSRDEKDF